MLVLLVILQIGSIITIEIFIMRMTGNTISNYIRILERIMMNGK